MRLHASYHEQQHMFRQSDDTLSMPHDASSAPFALSAMYICAHAGPADATTAAKSTPTRMMLSARCAKMLPRRKLVTSVHPKTQLARKMELQEANTEQSRQCKRCTRNSALSCQLCKVFGDITTLHMDSECTAYKHPQSCTSQLNTKQLVCNNSCWLCIHAFTHVDVDVIM
jgi:hypothetical protein